MENNPSQELISQEEEKELKKINNNNIIINDNESNNKDKTFNHLKKLQKLIKKESALKEICK